MLEQLNNYFMEMMDELVERIEELPEEIQPEEIKLKLTGIYEVEIIAKCNKKRNMLS